MSSSPSIIPTSAPPVRSPIPIVRRPRWGEDVLSGFLGSRRLRCSVTLWRVAGAGARAGGRGAGHLRRRGAGQHTQGSEHGQCLRRCVSPGDVDQRTKESGDRNLPLVIRHPGDDHLGSHCQPIGDAARDLQRAARLADITRKIGINRLDELNRIKIEAASISTAGAGTGWRY